MQNPINIIIFETRWLLYRLEIAEPFPEPKAFKLPRSIKLMSVDTDKKISVVITDEFPRGIMMKNKDIKDAEMKVENVEISDELREYLV
jgi:hypothetical protein